MAFRQDRRGTARPSTVNERWALGTVASVLGVLVVVSGVFTAVGRSTVAAEERVGALTVDMKRVKFVPDSLGVSTGEEVRLFIRNSDLISHTFIVKDHDIDLNFGPGDEKLVLFTPVEVGTLEYICDVPGHGNMKGTIEVAP